MGLCEIRHLDLYQVLYKRTHSNERMISDAENIETKVQIANTWPLKRLTRSHLVALASVISTALLSFCIIPREERGLLNHSREQDRGKSSHRSG